MKKQRFLDTEISSMNFIAIVLFVGFGYLIASFSNKMVLGYVLTVLGGSFFLMLDSYVEKKK